MYLYIKTAEEYTEVCNFPGFANVKQITFPNDPQNVVFGTVFIMCSWMAALKIDIDLFSNLLK